MEVFNIISGVCSIVGLLISLFTATKVVKISKNFNSDNDYSNVKNKIKGTTINGNYTGRDNIKN